MKNILWFQDPLNRSQDVISFNGDIITPPSNPLYIEKYKVLSSIDDKINKTNKSRKKIYFLGDGYFVKSYFAEKDNLGRNIGFMFYCDTIDKSVLEIRLKEEAKINNKTCPESLITQIREFKTSNLNLKRLILAGVILAIVIILISLITNK